MSKTDLKKELAWLYNPSSKEPAIVDIPPMRFFMVDGAGDPNTSIEYRQAMEALYGASFTLKFMLKKRGDSPDYAVMPLEGLWYMDDMREFSMAPKDLWQWTSMIMQPDFITPADVQQALDELRRKKHPPALGLLRFETYQEGVSAQIMHIGPYAAEEPTINKLHAFIEERGYVRGGKHHEIYLGDPRRTAPEKLKTVIRQPIRKP